MSFAEVDSARNGALYLRQLRDSNSRVVFERVFIKFQWTWRVRNPKRKGFDSHKLLPDWWHPWAGGHFLPRLHQKMQIAEGRDNKMQIEVGPWQDGKNWVKKWNRNSHQETEDHWCQNIDNSRFVPFCMCEELWWSIFPWQNSCKMEISFCWRCHFVQNIWRGKESSIVLWKSES